MACLCIQMHLGAHAALFVVTRAPVQLSHATFLVGADGLLTDLLLATADVPLSAACVSATPPARIDSLAQITADMSITGLSTPPSGEAWPNISDARLKMTKGCFYGWHARRWIADFSCLVIPFKTSSITPGYLFRAASLCLCKGPNSHNDTSGMGQSVQEMTF